MKKISLMLVICLGLVVLSLGCLTPEPTNETKLEVTEGIGVVGTLNIDKISPGLDGYVSLVIRNNLEGENAKDLIISLDNVKPFGIFECGGVQDPDIPRPSTCTGFLDLDDTLAFRQHGTSRVFPGEELEVYWRLRAPSKDEISDIALEHPIYYDIEYSYRTSFNENIVFMSKQEIIRRRQLGEEWRITGSSGMGAGEIRIEGTTDQPQTFFFAYPDDISASESNFTFFLSYNVENKGDGFPISDMVVIVEYPKGKTYNSVLPVADLEEYGWYNWLNFTENCTTGDGPRENCGNWAKGVIGEDDWQKVGETNKDNLIARKVSRDEFVELFPINIPFVLTSAELTELKQRNIPLKIYTFKIYTMYRYFTEGKEYITVYPLRIN